MKDMIINDSKNDRNKDVKRKIFKKKLINLKKITKKLY